VLLAPEDQTVPHSQKRRERVSKSGTRAGPHFDRSGEFRLNFPQYGFVFRIPQSKGGLPDRPRKKRIKREFGILAEEILFGVEQKHRLSLSQEKLLSHQRSETGSDQNHIAVKAHPRGLPSPALMRFEAVLFYIRYARFVLAPWIRGLPHRRP